MIAVLPVVLEADGQWHARMPDVYSSRDLPELPTLEGLPRSQQLVHVDGDVLRLTVHVLDEGRGAVTLDELDAVQARTLDVLA